MDITKSDRASQLEMISGKCRLKHLWCSSSACVQYHRQASVWNIDVDAPHILHLKCGTCKNEWAVCTVCTSAKVGIFTTSTKIRRHTTRVHVVDGPIAKKQKKLDDIDNSAERECNEIGGEEAVGDISKECIISPMPEEIDTLMLDITAEEEVVETLDIKEIMSFFRNSKSKNYFHHELKGEGCAYLAALCQYDRYIPAEKIDPREVDLQMLLATFSRKLTPKEQDEFCAILDSIIKLSSRRCLWNPKLSELKFPKSEFEYTFRIPTSKQLLRKYYHGAKNSIAQNLPRPNVQQVGDHSYVSIIESIEDLLAFGLHKDEKKLSLNLEDVDSKSLRCITKCRRAKTIHRRAVLRNQPDKVSLPVPLKCLLLFTWSDDFEPNNSIKANRQSVWLKTFTVVTTFENSAPILFTSPVGVGPKGVDHSVVEEKFHEEMLKLSTNSLIPMYNGHTKSLVGVHAEVIASLNDQPERRSCLCLSGGNSIYHARWGYAMNLKKLKKVMPACPTCYESLLKEKKDYSKNAITTEDYFWRQGVCCECSCWAIEVPHPLLRYKPDDDYPQECLGADKKIDSTRLDFEILKKAVDATHSNIMAGIWNKKHAHSYLRCFCLNAKFIGTVLDRAINCKMLSEADQMVDTMPELYSDIMEEVRNDPESYRKCPLPPNWNETIPLDRYGDVPMHLLFLGAVKTCLMGTQAWLKSCSKNTAFYKFSVGILDSIKDLNISWCRVLPYSKGKFGGWVSENHLGMSRLIEWFYPQLTSMEEEVPWTEPEKAQSKWLKKDNAKWLMLRGINHKGYAADLRDKVAMYMASGDHAILPKPGVKGDKVLELLSCLSRLIGYCMSSFSGEKEIQQLEMEIRIFLNLYNEFDMSMEKSRKNKGDPGWLTHYNFMSLLNLPDQIRETGPLRDLWEGDIKGEGFLRTVKPKIKTGLTGRWQDWVLYNVLEDKSFSGVLQCDDDVLQPWESAEYSASKDEAELLRNFSIGKPMSGFVSAENNAIYVSFKQKDEVVHRQVILLQKRTVINGLLYSNLELQDENLYDLPKGRLFGMLFLPKLGPAGLPAENSDDAEMYTAIDSNWRSLRVEGNGFGFS